MTTIIMCGCNGKMGQVITELIKEDNTVQITAGIDITGEKRNAYPVYTSPLELEKALICGEVQAEVIIDFSAPCITNDVLAVAKRRKLPVVLCTTGLSSEQIMLVEESAKEIPVLRSANMSLGINLLLELIQKAAVILANTGFDMEIVEKHHNQKVDAPSGTALALAASLQQALEEDYALTYDRSGRRTKRPQKEIGISAVRGGTIVGEHEVIFAGTDEVIELKHTAYSKAIFAKGAIEAAKYLAGCPAGMYQMQDVIKKQS